MYAFILSFNHHQNKTEFITFTNFDAIAKKSLYRVISLPLILTAVIGINQNNFFQTIQNYPITCALIMYGIGNYIIDSYFQYKKINSILTTLRSLDKINNYLICINMLQNNHQFNNNDNQTIASQICFYSGFSIFEIEEIVKQISQKALEYLHSCNALYCDVGFAQLENIFLKELKIDEIITLFKKDQELYQELKLLQNDDNYPIENIIKKIGLKIKNEILFLLQNIKTQ